MQAAQPWFLKSSSSWNGLTRGQAAIFCVPSLVVAMVCLWSLILRPALDWTRSRDWEPTEAVMEKAWVKITHRTRHSMHQVAVEFRYRYQGQSHLGTRHSFHSSAIGEGEDHAQQVVNSLPAGKTVTCWVNPDDPDEAVLDPSLPLQSGWAVFFATPFLAMGLTGLGFVALPWLRRRFFARRLAQMADLVLTKTLPTWVLQPFDRKSDTRTDNIALVSAADDRMVWALSSAFPTLFCNSITGVLVWLGVASVIDHAQAGVVVFLLILSPFVAIGIFFFWITLRCCRLLRRPRWVAAMRAPPGTGGGTVAFCWTWLADARLPHPPKALVRVVAQAALWDERSHSLAPGTGGKRWRKLANPPAARKGQVELAAVEVPLHDAGKEIRVKLPRMPALPTETGRRPRRMSTTNWGVWWQVEVTYRDGMIELADLTEAKKLG